MNTHRRNEELECFDYFELRANPFPVVPDVDNFYVCDKIDRIVTEIVHGIVTRKGFLVLTGEVGLGKTTISRKVMRILEEKGVNTALVFHSVCQEVELLREINQDFGIASESLVLADQMKSLKEYLLAEHERGKNSAILIDDAQNLDHKTLEMIRTISNLETDHEKLVQILLVGQPELAEKLDSPTLRQLKSRVMISQEVHPLGKEELLGYVMFKLYMAGNAGTITVSKQAIRKVHGFTGGNFRRVNRLMERCLYCAFLRRTARISRRIVCEAQRDLGSRASRLFGRRFAWGLAATVSLYLVGWMVFPGGRLGSFWHGPSALSDMSLIGDRGQVGDGETYPGEDRSEETAHVADPVGADQGSESVPEGIRGFLSAYGLSKMGPAFLEGLRGGRLDRVSDMIFRETGYRMVQLSQVPEGIRSRYTVLHLSLEASGEDLFVLFWKPDLEVNTFYLNYQGEEIRDLEVRLLSLGYYDYRLDGLVGPRLMAALNRFQMESDLPITGFPDSQTVFLLCHASKEDAYE